MPLLPWTPVKTSSLLGFTLRDAYPSEMAYFRGNPQVAGMAAEDDAITLNPYTSLSRSQRDAVAKNEAIRLFMRKNGIRPTFEVSDQQRKFFDSTPYANDEDAMKQTIIARYLSGDPSSGELTQDQLRFATYLQSLLR